MDRLLYTYLKKNKSLAIGEAGQFEVKSYPASIDPSNNIIFPPAKTILYASGSPENYDENFINFVARHYNLSNEQALEKIKTYVAEIGKVLHEGGSVTIAGLGNLYKSNDGYTFTASALRIYTPLAAKKIIREHAVHALRVGEKESSSSEMKSYFGAKPLNNYRWMYWVIGGLALAFIFLLFKNR